MAEWEELLERDGCKHNTTRHNNKSYTYIKERKKQMNKKLTVNVSK